MLKFEKILEEFEEVRYNFSKSFGKMIANSGAIVVRKPDLYSVLIAFLYITARDSTVIIN